MPRKKKVAGLAGESDVARALDRREEIAATLETLEEQLAKTKLYQRVEALREEDAKIEADVKEFVLVNYASGEGYEDERVKLTKVVGHTRTWNVDRLKELVKPGVFKKLTSLVVVPAKIDELVRAGKLDLEEIADAYEERANAPYVKPTIKSRVDNSAEAESLAEKLAS